MAGEEESRYAGGWEGAGNSADRVMPHWSLFYKAEKQSKLLLNESLFLITKVTDGCGK